MEKENLSPHEIDTILNTQSGMLGVSEKTSDNREIEEASNNGIERAVLIEDMFCHQLVKYIGGYAAAMGGIDALVFTGGIGENNPHYRKRVAEKLAFMGAEINDELNSKRGIEADISKDPLNTKLHVMVVPTNEELLIARDTLEIITKTSLVK